MPNGVGMRYTKEQRPWTSKEEHMIIANIGTLAVPRIAESLGRTTTAVRQRVYDLGINAQHEAAKQAGMTPAMAAAALGVRENTIRTWTRRKWIKVKRGIAYKRTYITIDAAELSRFLLAFGALLACIKPTDLAWREEVAEAREALHKRYISMGALVDAMGVLNRALPSYLRREHGFPEPSFRLGGTNGDWYDRALVRAWADAHPRYKLIKPI